jgi:hypothetical protein
MKFRISQKKIRHQKNNSYKSNFLGGMLRGLEVYNYFTCYLKLMDMTVPQGGELAWFRV